MNSRLVTASPRHIGRIARGMRAIDRAECEAFGRSPKDALRYSLRSSLSALTAIDEANDEPFAMFGVVATSLLGREGSPWFLGTDRVLEFGRDMLVTGGAVVEWWFEQFDTLDNMVSADNRRAIRLLEVWGAKVSGDRQQIGGTDFRPFRFTRAIQAGAVAA